MKTTLVKEGTKNSMRLQGIGIVLGVPASEIKEGDFLIWNFGYTSEVTKILKETEKTVTLEIIESGKIYERKLNKTRIVCRAK